MTLLVPLDETATNKDNSGDQQTDNHWFASASTLAVHVSPSGEVITWFVPSSETATNNDRSGDQQIPCHEFASVADLDVHFVTSVRVAHVQLVPFVEIAHFFPVAMNADRALDQTTLLYVPAGMVRDVQAVPSGEVAHTLAPTATQRSRVGE